MNTEIGYPENGFIYMDEMMGDFSIFATNHCTSSQFQITIKPRVPNATAVFFCTYFDSSIICLFSSFFNSDAR